MNKRRKGKVKTSTSLKHEVKSDVRVFCTKAVKEDGKIKVVITKEIVDRYAEIVKVDGLDLKNYKKNPVFIDAHASTGSVVDKALGILKNITKEKDKDGIKMITAEIDFAPTPNGQLAKELFEGGYVSTVSIGFRIMPKGYDMESRTITKSELIEVSAVLVPANTAAQVIKAFKIDGGDGEKSIRLKNALMAHFANKPALKAYRKLLLGDELCNQLGYTKTGVELTDIENVFALLKEKALEPKAETPPVKPKVKNSPKVVIDPEAFARSLKRAIDSNLS